MDGEGGFEFVEDRVCIYLSAFLGLGFLSRDVLESPAWSGTVYLVSSMATL